jgi:glycosyltransferase involved in cell wall biosynthesis
MDEWKGHRLFLEAAQKVLTQLHAIRFLVVGDGALRNELEAFSKDLGVEDNVIFCGYRDDIPEILAGSNILVSASLAEHFGRVIIEAMAMAKPVVGTRAGGVPEIVIDGQTGILIEPTSSEEMAQAILSLLADPRHAREMGVAGLNRVRDCFSIEKHTREIEEIYKSF